MFQFLNKQDDTPFFQALAEKGEGRLHQQAVAKAWANTEFGKALCQMGGKLTGPALGQWMQLMSRVNPDYIKQNSKYGRAKLQEKLDSDPEFYADWIDKKSKGALKFKEEFPELFKEYQKRRVDAIMQWRLDNPEEHEINQKNWREAGQKRSQELECWRIGWDVAHENYKLWQGTEDYQRFIKEASDRMSKQRKDPNSQFNINMRKAHAESEAKRISELENIKKATEKMSSTVQCTHCDKRGAYRVMKRWHFDNCKLFAK
jgi:hypothetical protein